ncbi:class I SAM-dependent methyltransferase [Halomonas sp. XH26]|uniref:class I SAM-dependent methyltransferase n=1 Tax=Halomonas sp. XH26 TaxID=2557993 RepID=UPI0020A1D30A|nr:class I SAM-dependent methyltransferase [Halomonas sp. XH26]UTA78628.1 class I SAM-dependent methyltransferase [Halomonas sp. XH26]
MADKAFYQSLSQEVKKGFSQSRLNHQKSVDQLYTQLESLSWLQRQLTIKGHLPPLRGWPTSPDFLLKLHTWILKHKPKLIVETGSGASTLVIADALRQNGAGKLISLEHLQFYADETSQTLLDENLTTWVDLRVCPLESWTGDHLNPSDADKPSRWYSLNFKNINNIDILIVDGPPGNTCLFARYPALPALFNRLSPNAEVWMDDANRQEEKEITEEWAKRYGFEMEFISLEKGMSRLWHKSVELDGFHCPDFSEFSTEANLGLDFSLPEDQ